MSVTQTVWGCRGFTPSVTLMGGLGKVGWVRDTYSVLPHLQRNWKQTGTQEVPRLHLTIRDTRPIGAIAWVSTKPSMRPPTRISPPTAAIKGMR